MENTSSSSIGSLTGKKRQRDQDSSVPQSQASDHVLSLEESLTFSDTLVALRIMRAQFPHLDKVFEIEMLKDQNVIVGGIKFSKLSSVWIFSIEPLRSLAIMLQCVIKTSKNGECISFSLVNGNTEKFVSVQPFILRSQLYSSVKDRTQVDRELELLRRERVLRVFKLNTGQDDHAIMFIDDYLNQIKRAVTRMQAKKQDDHVVFEWFKTYVLDSKLETSIGHEELCSFLSSGGNVKDQHISLLISAGLLTRQLIDPNLYWFAIPNIGLLLKGLSQGRKELLSFLNRRKYKEMMLASLEKKNLRLSPLDMRFHLRDLIGSGHLKTIETPSGLVVRVVKD